MIEQDVSSSRLESFSDGVIAIIVTVMVLELKAPHDPTPRALLALWPDFLSYAVSFGFVAIYWVNHRFVLRRVRAVDERIVWTNVLLLFAVSMIPFSTAYMGETRLASFPMALYGGELLVCGMAFALLRTAVAANIDDETERETFNGRRVQAIGIATMLILMVAIGMAFVQPPAALGLIFLSSLLHLAPLTRRGPA
jgi:TMEM175 potassium channel family protein